MLCLFRGLQGMVPTALRLRQPSGDRHPDGGPSASSRLFPRLKTFFSSSKSSRRNESVISAKVPCWTLTREKEREREEARERHVPQWTDTTGRSDTIGVQSTVKDVAGVKEATVALALPARGSKRRERERAAVPQHGSVVCRGGPGGKESVEGSLFSALGILRYAFSDPVARSVTQPFANPGTNPTVSNVR